MHILQKIQINRLKGVEAGRAFEHFIFMEIRAFLGLNELDNTIQYWRTKTGLEVDFVLDEGNVAVEVFEYSDHVMT